MMTEAMAARNCAGGKADCKWVGGLTASVKVNKNSKTNFSGACLLLSCHLPFHRPLRTRLTSKADTASL